VLKGRIIEPATRRTSLVDNRILKFNIYRTLPPSLATAITVAMRRYPRRTAVRPTLLHGVGIVEPGYIETALRLFLPALPDALWSPLPRGNAAVSRGAELHDRLGAGCSLLRGRAFGFFLV
jgi:hypothetical protein